MNLDKTLEKRTSIKNYSNKKPKDDKIIDAIEAASLAPSPGNLQILKYIIVDEPELIEKIAKACQQPFIRKAPIIIIICSDSKSVEKMYDKRTEQYTRQHAGAAIENFLLKITDMKLASCWVGAFSETTIKNTLKIPDKIRIEAVLPIAYESKEKTNKQKSKPNLGNIVYFDEWKNKYKKKPRETGTH